MSEWTDEELMTLDEEEEEEVLSTIMHINGLTNVYADSNFDISWFNDCVRDTRFNRYTRGGPFIQGDWEDKDK